MKFLFHNQRLPELKGNVGVGRELHWIRSIKYRPHVGDSRFFGEHRHSTVCPGRTYRQQSFQLLADNHFAPVVSRRKQEL